MSTTIPTVSLSNDDRRCIEFAHACTNLGVDPLALAGLIALARRAFKAGTTECNVSNYSADPARERVRLYASNVFDWETIWPGLWPEFTKHGQIMRIPS